MFETLEHGFEMIVHYGILVLEAVGVAIIAIAAIKALMSALKRQGNSRLVFSEGIATALSFLLGAEVLKTITAPDWQEIGMTCAVFAMRAAMSLLLHWETKQHGH